MEKQKLGQSGYAINDPTAPIGVFDSGVGGLTVAREIMRQIPNERLIYFGDTARVPYEVFKADCTFFRDAESKSDCCGL